MKQKPQIIKNWPKYLLTWGLLIFLIIFVSSLAGNVFGEGVEKLDPEKYCPMGGIQAFVTYLTRGSLPCSMTSVQIIMGLALAAAVIAFSKLFCAYVCPVGAVEDILTRIRKTLCIKDIEISQCGIADKILRIVKYALLFWIVYMTATASELFCKNLDPYYAVATGFKGEITLWMSIITLALVIIPGFFIKRFWCRYICPLGAISNSLKFWVWMVAGGLVFWALNVMGLKIDWYWILAAFCLAGYLLEILCGKPKAQILHVMIDTGRCGRHCYSCQKQCPYNIDVPAEGNMVRNVDCMLCGECVAACPTKALSVGAFPSVKSRPGFLNYLPAILAVALVVAAYVIGGKFELPTIDESWGIEKGMKLETVRVDGLRSVKCFGSSKAFKARMERVAGIHGVKTYVGTHSVVIKYDPEVVTEEQIQKQIFVPSNFRVWSPDPKKLDSLKIVTIRTEKMHDKLDLNYLGLQFRQTGKSIFGVESMYDCPIIVRVYMSPSEECDEEFFREIVEKKVLAMPVHGGGVKETPVDFKFVRLEPGYDMIDIDTYLHKMFSPFKAEFSGRYKIAGQDSVIKRAKRYEGKKQYVYEIADQNYEKPIIKRGLPFLGNHLSKEEGIIGLYLKLNKDLVPSIQIRYASPMTPEKIWNLITAEKWTITYKEGEDVREENPRIKFKEKGKVYKYEK